MTVQTQPTTKTQIGLSPIRMAQIRAIAEARQTTISDVLHELVRVEMSKGTIPTDVPGVTVATTDDGATVNISAHEFSLSLQRQMAGVLADRLKNIRQSKGATLVGVGKNAKARIKRRGKAAELLNIESGQTYTSSADILEDLGTVINNALAAQ